MTTQTTNPDEYSGWPNRETWAFNLWLTNDQGMYEERQSITECLTPDGWTNEMSRDEYGVGKCEQVGTALVEYLYDLLSIAIEDIPGTVFNMLTDIGSEWRIDRVTIGEQPLVQHARVDG